MNTNKKKQNQAGGGLYIALAICILSVICIGVYSAIMNIFSTDTLTDPLIHENKTPSIVIDTPEPEENTPIVPETNGTLVIPDPIPEPEPNPGDQNANAQPEPPSYTLPVAGNVLKSFSVDTLVYSQTMNDYRVHTGVDIASTLGCPVKALSDGVIKEIYDDPLMGQTIVIDHGNKTLSVYQNLSTELPDGIEVGASVEEGEVIAGIGETCLIECAEEPHLHFEVSVDGEKIDPMGLFE